MAWEYYTPGQVVGPIRVLELVTAGTRQNVTMYRCQWTCCGSEMEASHEWIAGKKTKRVQKCKSCCKKQPETLDLDADTPEPKTLVKIVGGTLPPNGIFVNGHYWPSLGRMGMRS